MVSSRYIKLIEFLLFLFIELNLSHNQISKLPDQLSEMKNIKKLNISYNSFVELPEPIAQLRELTSLIANNNFIIGELKNILY